MNQTRMKNMLPLQNLDLSSSEAYDSKTESLVGEYSGIPGMTE